MKLLGSTENEITKDKNVENVPHLEITEVVLIQCNIVNNDYKQDSRVLIQINYIVVYQKSISLENHIFLKTFNSEFRAIEVWFADQNSELLEIEDRIDITSN